MRSILCLTSAWVAAGVVLVGCTATSSDGTSANSGSVETSASTTCIELVEAGYPLLYQVTQSRAIPSGEPPLVAIDNTYNKSNEAELKLHAEVWPYLQALLNAAPVLPDATFEDPTTGEQRSLFLQSGYRSEAIQRSMANDTNKKTVARPGHSEHQLGTAVDFVTNADKDFAGFTLLGFTDEVGEQPTPAEATLYQWLEDHAWEYGFINSYPPNANESSRFEGARTFDRTGYSVEPWHWRFVGPEQAAVYRELYQSTGIRFTLEEFLTHIAASGCTGLDRLYLEHIPQDGTATEGTFTRTDISASQTCSVSVIDLSTASVTCESLGLLTRLPVVQDDFGDFQAMGVFPNPGASEVFTACNTNFAPQVIVDFVAQEAALIPVSVTINDANFGQCSNFSTGKWRFYGELAPSTDQGGSGTCLEHVLQRRDACWSSCQGPGDVNCWEGCAASARYEARGC